MVILVNRPGRVERSKSIGQSAVGRAAGLLLLGQFLVKRVLENVEFWGDIVAWGHRDVPY